MALTPKYRFSYCDYNGVNCRVDILEEGYVGAVLEVEGGPSPVVYSYGSSSDNKFDAIRASTATVTLIGGEAFQMEWMWTADERKYMVENYVDGALDWRGYIIPNGFRHEFKDGYYYATFTASDGLSTLKNKPFLAQDGRTYGEVDLTFNDGSRYPFILIATEILRKLDLDLNLWTCVDVYESRMSKTGGREGDPLANSTVDVNTYINDSTRDDIPYWQDAGEVFDCERVLRNLLNIWGAKIYQEGGTWKLKRVNADAVDVPTKYWRKYNTAAVYIGMEEVDDNVEATCNINTPFLIGSDHTIEMDRVYSQVAVLYEYTFLREGDTPTNLIKNGNFIWNAAFAFPPEWRYYADTIHVERRPAPPNPCAPGQVCTGLVVYGRNSDNKVTPESAIMSNDIDISQGDLIMLRWNQRNPPVGGSTATFGLLGISLEGVSADPNTHYYLVNKGVGKDGMILAEWIKSTSKLYFRGHHVRKPGESPNAHQAADWWTRVNVDVPPAPISGTFNIRIHGLGTTTTAYSSGFPFFQEVTFPAYGPPVTGPSGSPSTNPVVYERRNYYGITSTTGAVLTITEIFAGLIKNTSSEELPTTHRYLYPTVPRPNYSDRPEPVEVLNGDVVDEDHVSSIKVPGITGKLYWDTADEKYGYSSIGLVLARSIMDQYFLPNRILEGSFMGADLTFSSRIEMDFLPGIRFIVQRGRYDVKKCIWADSMLVQISNQPLPDGGSDGGNTLDPIWEDTGATRCVKDGSGENTGAVEKEQIDINPASNTEGQTQWVPSGTDTEMCPIGQPSEYLWGTQPATFDVEQFVSEPFTVVPGGVRVTYSNPGGYYEFFLHLTSLGLVSSVLDAAGYDNIADWQYLDDEVIDGHTYKVFRRNYPTGDYSGFPYSFIFS